MNQEARLEVAFLDTNALHFTCLYLEHAKVRNLYPFSPDEDSLAKTMEDLNDASEASLKNSLKRGLVMVHRLSKPDIRVEYSSMSELELIAGRARGRAIEKAAREGIPDRMWSRFHDKEIDARLSPADLTNIKTRVEGLGTVLEEAGIFATLSDAGRARDVLDLAKGIASLVYLGLSDSVIYASALVADVDYLITEDKHFRGIVNRIRNDQRSYDEVWRQVRDLVGKIILRDPAEVTLPKAPRLSLNMS